MARQCPRFQVLSTCTSHVNDAASSPRLIQTTLSSCHRPQFSLPRPKVDHSRQRHRPVSVKLPGTQRSKTVEKNKSRTREEKCWRREFFGLASGRISRSDNLYPSVAVALSGGKVSKQQRQPAHPSKLDNEGTLALSFRSHQGENPSNEALAIPLDYFFAGFWNALKKSDSASGEAKESFSSAAMAVAVAISSFFFFSLTDAQATMQIPAQDISPSIVVLAHPLRFTEQHTSHSTVLKSLVSKLPLLDFPFSLPGSDFFASFGKEEAEVVPSKGNCSTCIGVVDDTLGSCGSTANCISSYDDRPVYFVAPWEYPTGVDAAVEVLAEAVASQGGVIQEQNDRYLYATFTDKDSPTDDVEFLFSDPQTDKTVNVRAASRSVIRRDGGRNAKRLERIRNELRWEQVPILRNRQRLFVVIESPWDNFGPEPPPEYDYNKGLDFVPDGE